MKDKKKYVEGMLRINANGRYELNNYELHCGDVVELKLCGKWLKTRVEHYQSEYYFVGLLGLKICNTPARMKA